MFDDATAVAKVPTGDAAATPESTNVHVAPASVTESKGSLATAVKPAEDVAESTGFATSEGIIEGKHGWDLFSYLFILLVIGTAAFAFWRFGGLRFAKLIFSGRERAKYRRLNVDLEH